MAELLLNWLNAEVGLSRTVHSFGHDFQSGYILGEILHNFNQLTDFASYVDKDTVNAKVNNFCRLHRTLTGLDVEGFNASNAYKIMSGDERETKSLLYKVKVALETLKPLKVGSTPKPCNLPRRIHRPKYDKLARDLFESSIRNLVESQCYLDTEKKMKRFRDEEERQRLFAQHMDRIEKDAVAAYKGEMRQELLDKAKREREHLYRLEQEGIVIWNQGRMLRKQCNAVVKQYKENAEKMRQDKRLEQIYQDAQAVRRGHEEFESRNESDMPATPPAVPKQDVLCESIEEYNAFVPQTATGTVSAVETLPGVNGAALQDANAVAKYMETLRTRRVEAGKLSQLRSSRRRRYLAEREDECSKRREALLRENVEKDATRASNTEIEMMRHLNVQQMYKSVMRANREYRESQYVEQKRVDDTNHRDSCRKALRLIKGRYEREVVMCKKDICAAADSQAAAASRRAYEFCKELVSGIVSLSGNYLLLKAYAGGEVVNETWSELKSCWVSGVAVQDENMDNVEAANYLSGEGVWKDGTPVANNNAFGNLVRDIMCLAHPEKKPEPPLQLECDAAVCLIGDHGIDTRDIAFRLGRAHNLAVLNPKDLVREAFEQDSHPFHEHVSCSLLSGNAVEDATVVNLIVHKLGTLTFKSGDFRGWLLEDFPRTQRQSNMLEMAITGVDHERCAHEPPRVSGVNWASYPPLDPSVHRGTSCFDIALIVRSGEELGIRRTLGSAVLSGVRKHVEFTPPVYEPSHKSDVPPWNMKMPASKENARSELVSRIVRNRTASEALLGRLRVLGVAHERTIEAGDVGVEEHLTCVWASSILLPQLSAAAGVRKARQRIQEESRRKTAIADLFESWVGGSQHPSHASPPADAEAFARIMDYAQAPPRLGDSKLTRRVFVETVFKATKTKSGSSFDTFVDFFFSCMNAYFTTRHAKVRDFFRKWALCAENARLASACVKSGETISAVGEVASIGMDLSVIRDVFKKIDEKWAKYVSQKSPPLVDAAHDEDGNVVNQAEVEEAQNAQVPSLALLDNVDHDASIAPDMVVSDIVLQATESLRDENHFEEFWTLLESMSAPHMKASKEALEKLKSKEKQKVFEEVVVLPPSIARCVSRDIALDFDAAMRRIQTNYCGVLKLCFSTLRDLRRSSVSYLVSLRKSFAKFLARADGKQEVVTSFRHMFNGDFGQELRVLPEVKDELFMRCVECEEELGKIVDEKEKENGAKIEQVMADGWLEAQRFAIAVQYLTLMDLEVKRYGVIRKLVLKLYNTIFGAERKEAKKAKGAESEISAASLDIKECPIDKLATDYKDTMSAWGSKEKKGSKNVAKSDDFDKCNAMITGAVDMGKEYAAQCLASLPKCLSSSPAATDEDGPAKNDLRRFQQGLKCLDEELVLSLSRVSAAALRHLEGLSGRTTKHHASIASRSAGRMSRERAAIEAFGIYVKAAIERSSPLPQVPMLGGDSFYVTGV